MCVAAAGTLPDCWAGLTQLTQLRLSNTALGGEHQSMQPGCLLADRTATLAADVAAPQPPLICQTNAVQTAASECLALHACGMPWQVCCLSLGVACSSYSTWTCLTPGGSRKARAVPGLSAGATWKACATWTSQPQTTPVSSQVGGLLAVVRKKDSHVHAACCMYDDLSGRAASHTADT